MPGFVKKILDIIFPPKCIFCNCFVTNSDFKVCVECEDKLPYNENKRCRVCDVPIDQVYGDMLCSKCKKTKRPFALACAPFIYKNQARRAIIKYKFNGRKSYAKTFSSFMCQSIDSRNFEADIITFVPLHFLRYGQRGFNQSALLAEYISKELKIPIVKTLLKTKNTKPISSARHRERSIMVRGAYKIRESALIEIKEKNILIIDDIQTTGETLCECARVLKRSGAKKVFAATVAVTPKTAGII